VCVFVCVCVCVCERASVCVCVCVCVCLIWLLLKHALYNVQIQFIGRHTHTASVTSRLS